MLFELHTRDDFCILRLSGRFVTGSDSDYLRIRECLEGKGYRNVVADCREVPYLDSTGISFMVGLYKALRDSGGYFALAKVNRRIREVLEITGLSGIIRILDEEQPSSTALSSAA